MKRYVRSSKRNHSRASSRERRGRTDLLLLLLIIIIIVIIIPILIIMINCMPTGWSCTSYDVSPSFFKDTCARKESRKYLFPIAPNPKAGTIRAIRARDVLRYSFEIHDTRLADVAFLRLYRSNASKCNGADANWTYEYRHIIIMLITRSGMTWSSYDTN